MRRVLVTVAALGMLAAACGGKSGTESSPAPLTPPTSAPAASEGASPSTNACATDQLNLVKPGQLTVGTDNPAYPPWFSGGTTKGSSWKVDDPNNGKGLESAVAFEVAKRLGFSSDQVEWVVAPFNQTYAPGSKNYDFAIEQISFTKKRAEAVDFSDSYYDVNQALVAIKGTPVASATSLADLKDFSLAAPIGTTAYTYITDVIKPNKEPRAFDQDIQKYDAVATGQIDGALGDLPVILAKTKDPKYAGTVAACKFQPPVDNAWILPKDSKIIDQVNQIITDLKNDGTLAAWEKQYVTPLSGGADPNAVPDCPAFG